MLAWWRIYGVSIDFVPMNWSEGSYEEKFGRVMQAIDQAPKGKRVVLIGASAGGSMVINALAARPDAIYRGMSICGKNTGADTVPIQRYWHNLAFEESMYEADVSVQKLTPAQRRAFISIRSLYDNVVSVKDTLIPDCRQVILPIAGHGMTIFFALSVYSLYLVMLAHQRS